MKTDKPTFKKHLCDLTPVDFGVHPVWRNDLSDEKSDGELTYIPVKKLPVESLKNKVIGIQVTLANGEKKWARMSSIRLSDARRTEQFLSISIEKDGKWFSLRRYFDPGHHRAGPDALAEFLGLDVNDVFPIAYDLRPYAIGEDAAIVGLIPREPRERLSKDELHKLRSHYHIEGKEEELQWRSYLKHLEAERPESRNEAQIEAIKARLAEKEERDKKKRNQK